MTQRILMLLFAAGCSGQGTETDAGAVTNTWNDLLDSEECGDPVSCPNGQFCLSLLDEDFNVTGSACVDLPDGCASSDDICDPPCQTEMFDADHCGQGGLDWTACSSPEWFCSP